MNSLQEIIPDFLRKHIDKRVFLEHEVKGLLKDLGLPVPEGKYIGRDDTSTLSNIPPYPLVAKVSSTKIASKSDVHGVRSGIRNSDELRYALEDLVRIEHAEGVLVEGMAPQGVEVIVGGIIDSQFGPVVMFGLGGVFVELFKDVAFGLAPMVYEDAMALVRQVKGYRLLEGYRGRPPVDLDALLRCIIVVSEIMATGLVEEIDLNPVALYPEGAMVLDAKMALHK